MALPGHYQAGRMHRWQDHFARTHRLDGGSLPKPKASTKRRIRKTNCIQTDRFRCIYFFGRSALLNLALCGQPGKHLMMCFFRNVNRKTRRKVAPFAQEKRIIQVVAVSDEFASALRAKRTLTLATINIIPGSVYRRIDEFCVSAASAVAVFMRRQGICFCDPQEESKKRVCSFTRKRLEISNPGKRRNWWNRQWAGFAEHHGF